VPRVLASERATHESSLPACWLSRSSELWAIRPSEHEEGRTQGLSRAACAQQSVLWSRASTHCCKLPRPGRCSQEVSPRVSATGLRSPDLPIMRATIQTAPRGPCLLRAVGMAAGVRFAHGLCPPGHGAEMKKRMSEARSHGGRCIARRATRHTCSRQETSRAVCTPREKGLGWETQSP
jgi:hypothetical protein